MLSEGFKPLKLSVVVICWNDEKCILDCLTSVYAETRATPFEVIVVDNASTDGSVLSVVEAFPQARLIKNKANLGFGPGNNVGIQAASGEYVLILNPDTIIRERALDKLVAYADRHPEAGAFGCRVLNHDGSLQHSAQPRPTVWRYLIAALCLRQLGRWSNLFLSDTYSGWRGSTEREIGFQAGCCLLVRNQLLQSLGGFDARFSHQFEDADLCHRIWNSGSKVLFCPEAEIMHLGGRNRGNYPTKVILETERSKYRYFFKHYSSKGVRRIRWVSIIAVVLRYLGYQTLRTIGWNKAGRDRVDLWRLLLVWHWRVNPSEFVNEEPGRRNDSEPLLA
jgi:GT2 family glycosyltransferase